MTIAIAIFFCLINIGISWWNAYVCGSVWEDSKTQGGFMRLLVWCGAIQSGIGFSAAYFIVLVLVAMPFLQLTPEQQQYFLQFSSSLFYLLIIVPALGTGLIITIHSWMEAIRTRSLGSMAVAGWNTYAQASNMMDAASNLGEVTSTVGSGLKDLFSGGDDDDIKFKILITGLLIVLCALMLGALTTALLIQRYARSAKQVLGRQSARA